MSGQAAELRAAAKAMREQHGPGHARHVFWAAAADLLDGTAAHYDDLSPALAGFLSGDNGNGDPDLVLAVARAYLGGAL